MKALPGRSHELHPASRAGLGNHAPPQALKSSASERSGGEYMSPAALSRFQPANQELSPIRLRTSMKLPYRRDWTSGLALQVGP